MLWGCRGLLEISFFTGSLHQNVLAYLKLGFRVSGFWKLGFGVFSWVSGFWGYAVGM
jgi:hypothetical protein